MHISDARTSAAGTILISADTLPEQILVGLSEWAPCSCSRIVRFGIGTHHDLFVPDSAVRMQACTGEPCGCSRRCTTFTTTTASTIVTSTTASTTVTTVTAGTTATTVVCCILLVSLCGSDIFDGDRFPVLLICCAIPRRWKRSNRKPTHMLG